MKQTYDEKLAIAGVWMSVVCLLITAIMMLLALVIELIVK